jgi:hypothetical protein
MAEILIWVAVAVAVLAVWLLAGRFTADRTEPGEGAPPADTMRGGML